MSSYSHAANARTNRDNKRYEQCKAKKHTLLSREIISVAVENLDPVSNQKLGNAIKKAIAMGLPRENIERLLKSPVKGFEVTENMVYEGYYLNIAIIITVQTNNRARTAPEIKSVLTKAGASVAETGSVLFIFENLGIVFIKKNKINLSFEEIEEYMLFECGAIAVEEIPAEEDSGVLIRGYFPIEDFSSSSTKLLEFLSQNSEANDFIEDSFIGYNPSARVELDNDKIEAFEKLIERLEGLDDVLNVFHNADTLGFH